MFVTTTTLALQEHVTAVGEFDPTLQNIIVTVDLDYRLDLKTIALSTRKCQI